MAAPGNPHDPDGRKRFIAVVIGFVVLLVVVGGVVVYAAFLRPRWRFNDYESCCKLGDDDVRYLCHQVIRFPTLGNAHDAFLSLARVGDETSVPRLISAFGSVPAPGPNGSMECTWWHCLSALSAITNQNAGGTQAAWKAWYAANKHKTRIEWIADGFGVAVKGTPQAVQTLLPVIGPADPREYTMRNAFLLLDTYSRTMVCEQAAIASKTGTPDAKRGAIWVAAHYKAPSVESMLRELGKDGDRTVRVLALNHLADAAAKRLTNPPGSLIRSFKWGPEHWRDRRPQTDYVVEAKSNKIVVKSKKDTSEIASAPGRLIYERDDAIVAADGSVARILALPNLDEKASFKADGAVFGAAIGQDVIALLATSANLEEHHPTEGQTWMEGWSLATGERIWGPLVLNENGVEDDDAIIQGDPDVCYVSQDGLTSAIRIADGEIVWQNAPEGMLKHADRKFLVLESFGLRGLDLWGLMILDARDGRLLAYYLPDDRRLEFRFVTGEEITLVDHDGKIGYVFRLPAIEPEGR